MIIQDLYPGAQASPAQRAPGGSAASASGVLSSTASGNVSASGDGPVALVLALFIVAGLAILSTGRG